MFVFDTDHISIIQRQSQPAYGRLSQRTSRYPPSDFYFSVVSFHEQALGANSFIQQAKTIADVVRGYGMYATILADFNTFQVLTFDQAAAVMFDNLRANKIRIATMDLRIAAIAIVNNKTVLTRNLRDFRQVPGLNVEDWTV